MAASEPLGPRVVGEPAIDRLMRSLDYRLHPGVPAPTREQVAVVLHAMADHTAIMAGLRHRPDPGGPWPFATSMGRWLHDVGDQAERPAGPSTTTATPEQAPVAWLVVHALNTAGLLFDDPALDQPCCSNCCGACGALVAMQAARTLDDVVRPAAEAPGGTAWAWWVVDHVDAAYLARAIGPDCETCRPPEGRCETCNGPHSDCGPA